VLDGLARLKTELLHPAGHAVRREDAHQVVLQRQIEPRRAGVALASGAPTQLVVDAAGFVALGADHVQAAKLDYLVVLRLPFGADALASGGVVDAVQARFEVAAEHDVGAAAGHVGGDGDGADLAGAGDDLRFLLVVLGVQHLVRDAGLLEAPGHQL
jgi:hypothetical protein